MLEPTHMRASRGFTIVELMVVVAIIGIIAALAIPTVRAARKNATVQGSAFELKIWLDGLRGRAMREQSQSPNGLLAVVVDVPRNDPTPCAHGGGDTCAAYYLLAPQPEFTLNSFDPAASVANATVLDKQLLGRGIKFYLPATGRAAPNPFDGIAAFDPQLQGNCSGRACFGMRFLGNGEVDPEYPATTVGTQKNGVAFVLGSDVDKESLGSDQRGILVTFPTGLVKAYSVAR